MKARYQVSILAPYMVGFFKVLRDDAGFRV